MLDCVWIQAQQALSTWLPLAEMVWLKCLETEERPDLVKTILGRGGYLAAPNLAVIYLGRESRQG